MTGEPVTARGGLLSATGTLRLLHASARGNSAQFVVTAVSTCNLTVSIYSEMNEGGMGRLWLRRETFENRIYPSLDR